MSAGCIFRRSRSNGARIGYVRKPPGAAAPGLAPAAASKPTAASGPAWSLGLDRFELKNSELDLVDRTKKPPYRVFVSNANAGIEGLANEPPGHTATARLRGRFMGAGDLSAAATFSPGNRNADLDVKVEIAETPLPRLNDVFRAWGKFDVAAGEFLLFSELRVHDGRMSGYVKPIFREVQIYDARQDAAKPFLKKVYEGLVDVASKVLKNQKHDQVATATSIEGPVGKANASLLETVGGLIENAFVKAILPGFDRQVGIRHEPSKSH